MSAGDRVRLMLVRHGQTDSNLVRALDSRPPGAPLNDLGHAQAAALGGRLAGEPVTAVYASRAIRAQQTAAPIAVAHDLPVTVLDGVQEVFCGDLEGRTDLSAREEFDRTYAAWWRGDLDAHLPGGESAHDLRDRYVPAVERITIYQDAIEDVCATVDEVVEEVAITVVHEVAHHFGIDEATLHSLGWG